MPKPDPHQSTQGTQSVQQLPGAAKRIPLAIRRGGRGVGNLQGVRGDFKRSEEHTSELQSRLHLVCRLLLEKKKKNIQCLRRDIANSDSHKLRTSPSRLLLRSDCVTLTRADQTPPH